MTIRGAFNFDKFATKFTKFFRDIRRFFDVTKMTIRELLIDTTLLQNLFNFLKISNNSSKFQKW